MLRKYLFPEEVFYFYSSIFFCPLMVVLVNLASMYTHVFTYVAIEHGTFRRCGLIGGLVSLCMWALRPPMLKLCPVWSSSPPWLPSEQDVDAWLL